MIVQKIEEWYKIFNFNINYLPVGGISEAFILLIQVIWIIILIYMVIRNKNLKFIVVNLIVFLFSGVLSMYYHYINNYISTVQEYNDLLKYTHDDLLYSMNKWMVFFSYELIFCLSIFLIALYVIIFRMKYITRE